MSIDRLHKAATAAGYAMAAPDDDTVIEPRPVVATPESAVRAMVLAPATAPKSASAYDAIATASGWARNLWPTSWGRAHA